MVKRSYHPGFGSAGIGETKLESQMLKRWMLMCARREGRGGA